MRPAILVDNLSKQYRIGTRQRSAQRDLRETITEGVTGLWQRLRGHNGAALAEGPPDNEFWALKDVSFEVQPGEVVGVIGPNGAGKSTLLKILSRIVEPTSGRVEVRGRMGSLLEVGTGFHPELTGRENIYLNGSILGMSGREIDRKFDEIVDFSEIEKFLDTPVKRYSSGMYVRLAFAVAAHFEPEILIVDEVLSVGDAAFQRKCLGKVGAAARSGRTVLLVSHQMATVQGLCQRVALLDGGLIVHFGDACLGIDLYLSKGTRIEAAEIDLSNHVTRRPGSVPLLQKVRLLNAKGVPITKVQSGETLLIELTIDPQCTISRPQFGIGVEDSLGNRICSWCTYLSKSELPQLEQHSVIICRVDNLPLAPGEYFLSLSVGTAHQLLVDALENAVSFEVEVETSTGMVGCLALDSEGSWFIQPGM